MCHLCYKTGKLGVWEADSFGTAATLGLNEEEIHFCHFGIEEALNIAYQPFLGLAKPFSREWRGWPTTAVAPIPLPRGHGT